jgi:zinc/manganese transport system substrate-binding protein
MSRYGPLLRLSPRPGLGRPALAAALASALVVGACSSAASTPAPKPSIVVTYSVLGAVVKDLVGEAADVTVLMPNGADPHEWEPSARDIETVTKADLLVENGLGLEGGMQNAFDQAEKAGVKRFIASDHITIRKVNEGEGADPADPDQAPGAPDPHLWMDPLTMKDMVAALSAQVKTDLGIDVTARATDVESGLTTLDGEVATILEIVPQDRRSLVTGHESLGYFANRYGFRLVGAIIPSLTTQAEPSAAELAALAEKIRAEKVKAIFTELGTSPAVADAIGRETGAKVVELTTHGLPPDGLYATFMKNIATLVADNLK